MKKYILIMAVISISGCGVESLSSMNKAKQRFACANHGGVYQYVSIFHEASCRSGAWVDGWYELKLPEEYMPEGVAK